MPRLPRRHRSLARPGTPSRRLPPPHAHGHEHPHEHGHGPECGHDHAAADARPRWNGVPVAELPEILPEAARGAYRPITLRGQDVLHRPCAAVADPSETAIAALIDDMFASMLVANGVGLAANQIGVALRVFVYDCPDADDVRHAGYVINPVLDAVVHDRADRELDDEGCLSVPGPVAELARADRAVVRGVDLAGSPVEVSATGLLARCFQHECDHLDGTVYVDRLRWRERRRVLSDLERMREDVLLRWQERAAEYGKA